ncbi:MAG: hypothetical protein ACP5P4_09420 [Steroidobacteraceae bacterium]
MAILTIGSTGTIGYRLPKSMSPAGLTVSAAAPSAVIDVQATRALFGTTIVVGREFSVNDPNDARPGLLFRVVGIVAHARHGRLAGSDGVGAVYMDLAQTVDPSRSGWSWVLPTWYVALQTPLAPAVIVPAVRRTVSRTFPGVPLYDVRSMDERLSAELAPRRGMPDLVLIFGLGALAVAAVGLYAAHQQRPELGVRAALARPRGFAAGFDRGEGAG